ncbi:MAG: uroporphyrinogen decarboxylase family protein [Dehalococcoidales bacterium]|jgi:uroporphyrinogen-III decarboxylase/Holliday junction resolvase RusA-like endonuclease
MPETKWTNLTPQQKREQRFKWWLDAEGVNFIDANAQKAYKQRVQRLIDVYNVGEPDRVPVSLMIGALPAYLYGTDYHTCMYDYDKAVKAWDKFNQDFLDADSLSSPGTVIPGRVYDLLDYKLYKWPGHGLSTSATGIQFVEGEYMRADEYDALIGNPSDFWQRVYMPRVFGAFESWRNLTPLTSIIEAPAMNFTPYSMPEVQNSLKTLINVGNELLKYMQVTGEFGRRTLEAGYPAARGGFAKAPFDVIGDTLRGTQGIISDMFRRPDKLLEAIDVVTRLMIESVINSLNASKGLYAMFPLHKGADGWMSEKQFDKFYWPSLKKVINAFIDEGILVTLFAEGSYETRLQSVNEFPKGAVTWLFDRTDMAKAKTVLGDRCCIAGNVPTSLMATGTPKAVKEYCRKLIETCGKGGGYILSGGAQVDNGKPENVRAMLEAAREYGVYKK